MNLEKPIEIPPFLQQQIHEGKAVLFLGAGASLDAKDGEGRKPPTGTELGRRLSQRFLGGKFDNAPLAQIAEYAITESDLTTVQEFIRDIFAPFQPSQAHLLLPKFRWAGIATTNYDRLIETAYEQTENAPQAPQAFIENGDRIEDKMRDPRSVKLLKLHGCITRLTNPDCPLILTTDQYLTHRNGRRRLFEQLRDWGYERTIIFVGYSLQDADIRSILLELSTLADTRPRYFLVAPHKDQIERRFWETKKVTVIDATFGDFVGSIPVGSEAKATVCITTAPAKQHDIVERTRFTGVSLSKNCVQFLCTDVDYVKSIIKTEHMDPKQFYKGYSRDWSAIEQQLDAKRELMDSILLDYFIVSENEQTPGLTWLLIKGHAGAGKSILLRRLAWEAAKDYDCLALYVKGTARLNAAAIQELVEVSKERIYLFIDDVGERVRELSELSKQLEHSKSGVTLVSAERLNEWNVVGSGVAHLIAEEFELPYLSEREIEDLLGLLTRNNALGNLTGKPLDEQRNAFKDLAGLSGATRSHFIARQRRRVGDLGENVAEVFGAATFGARLHVLWQ